MSKQFYYLDGKDQKGPLSMEKLNELGIKPETLVWFEGMDDWEPAKNIHEFLAIAKKTPPPPPVIVNFNEQIKSNDNSKIEKLFVEDNNIKLWISLKIYATILISLIIVGLIGYSFVNSKIEKFRKSAIEKIDLVFNGKSIVRDGEQSTVKGVLEETSYNKEKKKIKLQGKYYLLDKEEWWDINKLYTIFKLKQGGLTIKTATKFSDEYYDIETVTAGDLGYTNPEEVYFVPAEYDIWGRKTSEGYQSRGYRKDANDYYKRTFDYFTINDKKGSYVNGKYFDISNLSNFKNEYFFMKTIDRWESAEDHSDNISWEDAKVFLTREGGHYKLALDENKYRIELILILGISCALVLMGFILVILSKPKLFRNLHLYGKRWENISFGEQILFFEFSFLGEHRFTEIINENVSRGILKITDKGNTINLSYPNKELFYKIDIIETDVLSLTSLKDGNSIKYVRVGANLESEK